MFSKIKQLWQKYNNKLWMAFRILRIPTFVALIGFLGASGGSANSNPLLRRCGIPLISCIYAYWVLSHIPEIGYLKALWTITLMSMWGGLALGIGIPDQNYPTDPNADEGSTLGRFYFNLFKRSHSLANYFTRGTCGLVVSLSMLSIPILTGQWLTYLLGSLVIILVWAINSWRGYGEFKFEIKGKPINLLYVDIVTYSVTGLAILAIIYRIVG